MKALYLWQQIGFPNFTWDSSQLITPLGDVHRLQGQLLGRMAALGFEGITQQVETITSEIIESSAIEGVKLNVNSVRSSVARHLGVEAPDTPRTDHYTEGLVNIMLYATTHYTQALTTDTLFLWHNTLFPTGTSDGYKITTGAWRIGTKPMVVVSGAMGKEKIHFQAPDSKDVPELMKQFLLWFNHTDGTDPILRAGIAHLWFVTIHPFDDGNGRISRIITEMLLAYADRSEQRFYSLSAEIMRRRKAYYAVLEQTQKSDLDITIWLRWFLETLRAALLCSLHKTERTLQKSVFWSTHQNIELNERQRKIINRLWDGFEGKLNTQKYAKVNHCSQDTALRDIQALIQKGILRRAEEGGRSTHYELVE